MCACVGLLIVYLGLLSHYILLICSLFSLFSGVSDGALSASVSEFDAILSGSNFRAFLDLSAKIGGDVATQGKMAESAFQAQRSYVVLASKAKQPKEADVPALLKPTSDKIAEMQTFR
jgi:hypothetical protein